MNMHDTILDVADKYEGVLLDAYGVFWGGNDVGLFPGVTKALQELITRGKIIGVLSNSTQLGHGMMEKIAHAGFLKGNHFHFLVTSGDIAKVVFKNEELPFETPKKKYYLFSTVHPKYSSPHALFEGSRYQEVANIEEADFIYLSLPHVNGEDQTDPELFRGMVEDVKKYNLPMVCANPDRFAHEGNPPQAVVRQGTIAAFYEQLGGEVVYIGKPAATSFSRAMSQFHLHGITDPSKVLMVGDTPETDIKGARNFGMSSALILETGIMKDRKGHVFHPHETPVYYVKRLAREL